MLDLKIEGLRLEVEAPVGQQQRVQPIARRAMELLADELVERWAVFERLPGAVNLEEVRVPGVELNLAAMSDEQAATAIAEAIRAALLLELRL